MNKKIKTVLYVISGLVLVIVLGWILNWGYIKAKHKIWDDTQSKDSLELKK